MKPPKPLTPWRVLLPLIFGAWRTAEGAYASAPVECQYTDASGAAATAYCGDMTQSLCVYCGVACAIECAAGPISSTSASLPRRSATLTPAGTGVENCIDGVVPSTYTGLCQSGAGTTASVSVNLGGIYDVSRVDVHLPGGSYNDELGTYQIWLYRTYPSPPPAPPFAPPLPPQPPATPGTDTTLVDQPGGGSTSRGIGWYMCTQAGATPAQLADRRDLPGLDH